MKFEEHMEQNNYCGMISEVYSNKITIRPRIIPMLREKRQNWEELLNFFVSVTGNFDELLLLVFVIISFRCRAIFC
ncbi:Nitrogen assimilation regulatory protein NtrX [Dirofilaria immitis]